MVKRVFVQQLPDLIEPGDYENDPEGRRIRLRIQITPNGLEILGDAQRPLALDEILEQLSPGEIEQMLCG